MLNRKSRRFRIAPGARHPSKKYGIRYVDEDYLHSWRLMLYIEYNSPEHRLCEGYFLMSSNSDNPFKKVKWTALGSPVWIEINEALIGSPEEIEDFHSFLDAHKIRWA